MTRLINLFNRRITLGNLLTMIATFLFAIVLRQLFLYLLDTLPVRGELQVIDISFLSIIIIFRFISSVFIEYLLDNKFNTPLFKGLVTKECTSLSMDNAANTNINTSGNNSSKNSDRGSSPKASSKEPLTEEQRAKVRQLIENKAQHNPRFKQQLEET
jgi:hypothetical protein